jgi:hypothetical protein
METMKLKVAIVAYMDDMAFTGTFREQTQHIIDIANTFYELHDIDINGSKSELIVINPSDPPEQRFVHMGRERTKVMATNEEVRFWAFIF